MNPIETQVHLLGTPSVTRNGRLLPGLGIGKPLCMLAYLSLKGESRREELAALFWGALPEQKARNAFRQTLHRLRSALGEERLPQNSTTLKIERDSGLRIDVVEFESALKRGAIDDALRHYRGPLLDGIELGEQQFDQWVIAERTRLDARYQWALHQGVKAASNRGDIDDALAKASLLSTAAPLAADNTIGEARLLVSAGKTAEARSALERYVERWKIAMDSEPHSEILEMLSRLRKRSPEPRIESRPSTDHHNFVGRTSELTRLMGEWEDVQSGRGATVLVSGDEGIGKSALLEQFLARAQKLGQLLLLMGRERSSGSMVPYASIAEALRASLDAPGLAGASQHLLAEAARLLPELRDRFELPPVAALQDDGARIRFFEGVAALLDAVAYEQPVCVVLEDFQNADPSTAALLEYLSGRLAGSSVGFFVALRPRPVRSALSGVFPFAVRHEQGFHTDSQTESRVAFIQLEPLAFEETVSLIASMGSEEVIPHSEQERIATLSGGIPYRALELARQAAGGMNPTGVPALLRDALWARLQGCSPAQQRLFVASALIERPVSIRMLAAASHLSETAALDAVFALEGLGLIAQTALGVKPRHDEAALLALEGTGPAGRALLAGWAADALSRESGSSSAELAHLFNIAGHRAAAFENSLAAGHDAVALGALESARHFRHMAQAAASSADEREKVEFLSGLLDDGLPRLGTGQNADIASLAGTTAPGETESDEAETRDEKSFERAKPAWVRQFKKAIPRSRPVMFLTVAAVIVGFTTAGLKIQNRQGVPGPLLKDTLFLMNRSADSRGLYFLVGRVQPGVTVPKPYSQASRPWTDSLGPSFINPRVSPTGKLVAVEKISAGGSEIYLFTGDGKQSRLLKTGSGDAIIAGWSPDGKWLLVTYGRTLADGNYDSDLYVFEATGEGQQTLEASPQRSVVEAAWSPDGTHIAWTARVGKTHQQDVFISNADGTDVRNISNSAGEDYHINWSSNGGRVAFTSDRLGNAEIFAYEIATDKIWRLTFDPAHDDRAVFSPDGNFVAFESTRGGNVSVFITRSWGGIPVKVSGSMGRFSITSWGTFAGTKPYLAFVRIGVESRVQVHDSVEASIEGYDQSRLPMQPRFPTWESLDTSLIAIRPVAAQNSEEGDGRAMVVGLRPGLARIAVSAGNWRGDTVFIKVGAGQLSLLSDNFGSGLQQQLWGMFGDSIPRVVHVASGAAFSPHSGRQRESGVFSREELPLQDGLAARVQVLAQMIGPTAIRSFSISLVASDSAVEGVQGVPTLSKVASIDWVGQAGRISYGVDRESWTEPVTALGSASTHTFEIQIDSIERVGFYCDGRLRWRSTLRAAPPGARARLWLSSRGAGDAVLFQNVVVSLGNSQSQTRR